MDFKVRAASQEVAATRIELDPIRESLVSIKLCRGSFCSWIPKLAKP